MALGLAHFWSKVVMDQRAARDEHRQRAQKIGQRDILVRLHERRVKIANIAVVRR